MISSLDKSRERHRLHRLIRSISVVAPVAPAHSCRRQEVKDLFGELQRSMQATSDRVRSDRSTGDEVGTLEGQSMSECHFACVCVLFKGAMACVKNI